MESWMNLVMFAPVVFFGSIAILERFRPARPQPAVRLWRLQGVISLAVLFGLSIALPMLWDGWLGAHRLIDASALGTFGGAAFGLVTVQLLSYAWHRSMHRVPFLWRFHQLHHAAERFDVYGSPMLHPVDIAGFTLASSLGMVGALGVTTEAAMLAGTVGTFLALFQHANVRTPRWLGYFVQRPESHSVHHQRGVHAMNYGDIALWDMVFGTFRNPSEFVEEVGFWNGASRRIGSLLIGRDVTEAPRASDESSRAPLFAAAA
ncbi:MAG: sterol desaturase family protein [bacterium]